MHLGVDVMCMHTNFGGQGLFGFGDIATFLKRPNFPFRPWSMVVEKFNCLESAQKVYASRDSMSRACTPVLVGVTLLVS